MLKKCLLGLFVGFVGFISFLYGFSNGDATRIYLGKNQDQILTGGYCVVGDSNYSSCLSTYVLTDSGNSFLGGKVFCNDNETRTIHNGGGNSCPIFIFDGSILNNDCPVCEECEECQECPEIDTGSILSGACDTNYCVQNDLCPSSSGSRSELMINNIVHEGKPLINISIPDNIYWDYATDDNQFDLYVGSGYNQDYIDSVLAINSYRPDNEDFTNIFVSGLTLIFPYIFVALLIVFIWKLLKRIFK